MGELFIEGLKGKIAYAQLLHDGSEVQINKNRKSSIVKETVSKGITILELPVAKPEVEIPVIEVFLK